MVKIGEVEFLVKFDKIGKSFSDVIGDALDDLDFGTDMSQKIDQIWYDLKQQYRISGTGRSYAQFKSTDYENLKNWWTKIENIENLTKDIMKRPRGPAAIGVAEEDWSDEEAVKEKVEQLRDLFVLHIDKAFVNQPYWESIKNVIGQYTAGGKQVMESNNVVQALGNMKKLIDEFENVTPQVTDILDALKELGVKYFSKGNKGERYFQIMFEDVGTGGTDRIGSAHFFDLLVKKMGVEETFEMLDRTEGILAAKKEDWKEALKEIFEDFTIKKGQAIPIPIAKLLIEMMDDIVNTEKRDIYRGREKGAQTAEDILALFPEGAGQDFAEIITERFGKAGWEALETFGLDIGEIGALLIEAKRETSATTKAAFEGQAAIAGIKSTLDDQFAVVDLAIKNTVSIGDLDKAKKEIIEGVEKGIIESARMYPLNIKRLIEDLKETDNPRTWNE